MSIQNQKISDSINESLYNIRELDNNYYTSKYDTLQINNDIDTIFYGIHGYNIKNLTNVIIFLHGFPYHQGMFNELIKSLIKNQNRTIISFDLRGFGKSALKIPTTTSFTAEQYASDIYQACKILGIKSATFCGHSMSSLICLQIALSYTTIVSNIITLGGSPRFFPDLKTGWDSTYTPFTEESFNSYYISLPGTYPFYDQINLEVCEPLTSANIDKYEADFTTIDETLSIINNASLKTYGYIWYKIFTNFLGGPNLTGNLPKYPPIVNQNGPADIRYELKNIKQPILIITSQGDNIVPSPASAYISENIGTFPKDITFILYDIPTYGTLGHVSLLTHPNLIYKDINNFLISRGL